MIQDIDDRPGFGAFWGEVQSTVHLGLGVPGCVTNGSFRDVDMLAPGFQIIGGRIGPSHAHVHMVQMDCDVNIFGMLAKTRRRDPRRFPRRGGHPRTTRYGSCPAAIDLVSRREKVILDMARTPGFTSADMRRRSGSAGEIH